MKTIDLLKELAVTVTEKFTDLYSKVSATEKSVLTMEMNLSKEFKKAFADLNSSIPKKYDDADLRKELGDTAEILMEDIQKVKDGIPEPAQPYDDAEVKESLSMMKASMSEMKEEFTPSDEIKEYDDSGLREEIASIDSRYSEEKKALELKFEEDMKRFVSSEDIDSKFAEIKEYDDSGLRADLEDLSKGLVVYDDLTDEKIKNFTEGATKILKTAEDRLAKTLEDVSKRVTYEMPIPVVFNGDPLEKGTFVLWENSLWLNKMSDNSSVPGIKNGSYMCLIDAPREIEHKGLFKEDEKYDINNIVMKDNASWLRVKGRAGNNELPGESWRLLAKGIKGRKGDKGDDGKSEVVETDQTKAIESLQDEIFILKGKSDAKDTE